MQQEQAGDVIVNCNGIEIFDNDFELASSEACEKYGIEDLTEASQRQWKLPELITKNALHLGV